VALLDVFEPDGRVRVLTLEVSTADQPKFSDFIVGRSPDVWLTIDDSCKSVSRLHAKFSPVADRWAIEDLGSRNGTRLNGQPLVGAQILHDKDEIKFATVTVMFRDLSEPGDTTTKPKQRAPSVTPGERKVLVELCRPFFGPNLLKRAATRREIADALFTGEPAIQQHLGNLYMKFHIDPGDDRRDRRDRLAVAVIEAGVIGPGDYDDRVDHA
jgi:pSer/pThr/pTyr-binding forkhead associated (FHA) protein